MVLKSLLRLKYIEIQFDVTTYHTYFSLVFLSMILEIQIKIKHLLYDFISFSEMFSVQAKGVCTEFNPNAYDRQFFLGGIQDILCGSYWPIF